MNSVGIDVSKEKSTVCILRPYGEVIMAPKELPHTETALNQLANLIMELDGESKIILEATGAYHFPIVNKLIESGLFVSVINPYVMKKYACASVRWGKTDKLDSVRIANYGIDNWFKLQKFKPATESYEELKILGRQYAHYISMKIESKLALTTLLDRVMPGIKVLLTGKRSDEPTKDKLSDFVEKYWHYDNITKMTERKFCEDYCKWAKKKGYYTPLAVDKKGKWCYSNTVRLIEKDSSTNTYTVEYTIDQKFLQDKSTKYPVVLNQSIHLYKPKQPDTSAYENTGEQAGHYLSPYMLLGDKTIKGEGWTFVRYETLNSLNIPADKIVSAKYVFHNLFDLEKEAKIGAYAVTADWCSINTRWFNRPPFDEKPISEVLIKDRGDYELDITALMKEMIANKERENAKYSVQNSFLIRSDSIDSNMIFASGDNGLFSPVLEIVLSE